MRTPLIITCLLLIASVHATRTWANCAAPLEYWSEVEGTTVAVCPDNRQGHGCEEGARLLREDVDTGQVVALAGFCVDRDNYYGSGWTSCFVDECVEPGTFRYGLEIPYTCDPYACWTSYYTSVTVRATSESCTLSEGNEGPSVFEGDLPWSGSDTICTYQNPYYPDPWEDEPIEDDQDAGSHQDAGNDGADQQYHGDQWQSPEIWFDDNCLSEVGQPDPGGQVWEDQNAACSVLPGDAAPIMGVNLVLLVLGCLSMIRRRARARSGSQVD